MRGRVRPCNSQLNEALGPDAVSGSGARVAVPREPLGKRISASGWRIWWCSINFDAEIQQAAGMSPESIREARLRLSLPEHHRRGLQERSDGASVSGDVIRDWGSSKERWIPHGNQAERIHARDARSHVVDVPEAPNLGLTYLVHTHLPTIWDVLGGGDGAP